MGYLAHGHPFLDGNGRLGRLLITLYLCSQNVLQQPLLYLSLYFKHHRDEDYRLLDRVRGTGDWESWLDFFLEGVVSTATGAVDTAQRLVALFQRGHRAGTEDGAGGRETAPRPAAIARAAGHYAQRGVTADGPIVPHFG